MTTVQLGEPATFTCVLPEDVIGKKGVYWFQQSPGDNLKLVVSFDKHANPVYGPEFSASRVNLKVAENYNNLTILRTIQEDEGMYHCAVRDWDVFSWNGTYLSLKGKNLICFL